MPIVEIYRDPKKINDGLLKVLTRQLQNVVASSLSCNTAEGFLSEKDIEVYTHDFGPFDIHSKDIEITVSANSYPEREESINLCQQAILARVEALITPKIGFVWLKLVKASFGEF